MIEKWLGRWTANRMGPFMLERRADGRIVGRCGILVSVIAPGNVASRRVAERLGAQPGETITLADSGDAVVWTYPADLR